MLAYAQTIILFSGENVELVHNAVFLRAGAPGCEGAVYSRPHQGGAIEDGELVLALPPGTYKLCVKDEAKGMLDSAYYQIPSTALQVFLPPPPPPPSLSPLSPPPIGGNSLNASVQGQTTSVTQPSNEALNFVVGAAGASITLVALLVAIAGVRLCWRAGATQRRVVLNEQGVERLSDAVLREVTRSRSSPATPSSLKSEVQQIIDDHQRPFPRGLRVVSDAERRSGACNILQSPQQSRPRMASRLQQPVTKGTSSGTTPQDVQRNWLSSAEAEVALSTSPRAAPQPLPAPSTRLSRPATYADSPSDADRRV